MEFRCRLGTAGGEIVEGVYVADSEARLRRELEDKGLFVLSLQRRGRAPGVRRLARPASGRIRRQEFLVFNQELATLLKAGMPLVQSLDILRQRVVEPDLQGGARRRLREGQGGTALSDAFGEHPDLFPAVYSASLMAGERTGNLDEVIRRYVAYEKVIGAVRRRTISALIYPAILVDDDAGASSASSCCGWCRRSRISIASSDGRCRSRPGSSSASRTCVVGNFR